MPMPAPIRIRCGRQIAAKADPLFVSPRARPDGAGMVAGEGADGRRDRARQGACVEVRS